MKKLVLEDQNWSSIFPHYLDSRFLGGEGKRWWTCPLCDGEDSFRLYPPERDPKGGWYCARCAKGGTGVSLIHEVTGKPYREIYYELETRKYNGGIPVEVARKVKPVPVRPEKSDEQKCREMQAAWDGAEPITEASPVWTYLSTRIPGLQIEWIGKDVRYHPGMEYVDAWGKRQGKFPVMLLRARSQAGKPCRLHRTYLTAEGAKVPFLTKRGKQRAKLEMSAPDGSFGSSVRLNTTRSRTLALVEGSETGFAVVARYRNRIEVRSLLNCGGLERADIRWDDYDHVIIYADRDRVDARRGYRPGEHHASVLAEYVRSLGKRVSIVRSVVEGADFCDVWAQQHKRRTQRYELACARRLARDEMRKRNLARVHGGSACSFA
nr:primase-helicase zinc-binding domain-containing protein [Burkholderia sp. Ac-20353]